jgi:hypothetical protein
MFLLGIRLHGFLTRVQSLAVILHAEQDHALPDVRLDECRVDTDRFFRIFECFRESSQLGVSGSPVVVSSRIRSAHQDQYGMVLLAYHYRYLRQSLDGFRIMLDSFGKCSRLEVNITLLSLLFSQLRVNVRLLLCIGFRLLRL